MAFWGMNEKQIREETQKLIQKENQLKYKEEDLNSQIKIFETVQKKLNDQQRSLEKEKQDFLELMQKNRGEIAEENKRLEQRRHEIVKLEADAKNNFIKAQAESFREIFETRIAALDNRKTELDEFQQMLESRLRELCIKEGEISQRELAVTEREQKADAGFADKASALAEEAKKQHEANIAEANKLKKEAQALEQRYKALKAHEESLVQREESIRRSEIDREHGYAEERSKFDQELAQKKNDVEKSIAKRQNQAISDLETELSSLRKQRLDSITEEMDKERKRIREEIETEKNTFWDEKKAVEKDIAEKRKALEIRWGTLSAWESELAGRKEQLEQDEKRLERQEERNQERYNARNEKLDDEVAERIQEAKANFEAQLEDCRKENAKLLNSLRIQSELSSTFEILKRQLGDQDPSEIILKINSQTDELTRLREELVTRPTDEMRARFEALDTENKKLRQSVENLKNQLTSTNDAIAEVGELKRRNSELTDENKSLEQRASLWEAASNEAHEELQRLRAAYERPQEVEARYKEIELPYFTGSDVKKPQKAESPVDELMWLQNINTACDAYGLHFNPRIVKAFHTALKTAEWSPLTILAGVSGTGKSELPRLYSHFGGIFFEPLSVQPNWDSQESMLGFFNSIDNKFDAQPVLRFLAQSQKTWSEDYPGLKDAVCMVLLDEMNLAHPELYFAEFLSKLELRRGKKAKEVPTLPVKIGAGMKPYELPLGRNILWTGTMNQDETTKSLSDKVLDRSIIIHFPRPTELKRRLELQPLDSNNRGSLLHKATWNSWLMQKSPFNDDEVAPFKKFIEEMNNALGKVGRAIGHRVWQSVEYYMANYPDVRAAKAVEDKKALDIAMHIAFEDQLVQKVMPKLRGIDTRGDSKTECLDKIRGQIIAEGFNLVEDFDLACELGYGQFIWQSANYLKEPQDDMNS